MTRCEDVRDLLEELASGELSGDRLKDVERHLSYCVECADQRDQLLELRERARELAVPLEPENDLWPRVRARLEPKDNVVSVDFRRKQTALMLVAAAVVVGFAIAALVVILGGPTATPEYVQNQDPIVLDGFESAGVGESYASIEVERRRIRAQLLDVLAARGDEISPQTRATVIENLEVIDEAFGRIAEALKNDPNSPELNQMLLAAYYSELGMLRQVSKLPSASQQS